MCNAVKIAWWKEIKVKCTHKYRLWTIEKRRQNFNSRKKKEFYGTVDLLNSVCTTLFVPRKDLFLLYLARV